MNEYDIIPRLSLVNLIPFAEEVFLFKNIASKQLDTDVKAFKAYARSMGAASRMGEATSDHSSISSNQSNTDSNNRTEEVPIASSTEPSVDIEAEYTQPPPEYTEDPLVNLVVPGKIIMLGKGLDGVMKAALVNHAFHSLRSIQLIDSCVEDHDMYAYAASFASVSHTDGVTNNYAKIPEMKKKLPMKQPAIVDGKYKNCGVCDEDVVWPYLTKSIASRVSATCNCILCGKIVCSVCAPAGEQIPGDGYGQKCKLPDHRRPLPLYGLLSPNRLCLPCFFNYTDHY